MTKHIISIGVLLFFSIFGSFAQSNTIRFSHLSIEDGISQATILGITQDSSGFLWLGTADGLNKYDPNRQLFKRYFPGGNNITGLKSNFIRGIAVTKKGSLWIGTDQGAYLFDRNNEISSLISYRPWSSIS